MRLNEGQPFHLTYCTNVHAGEEWEEVFSSLQQHVIPLKSRLASQSPFGIGLRLSHRAARSLSTPGYLDAFRAWLDQNSLYVFTINGFPYGDFHSGKIKDRVFAPDWRDEARLCYTRQLIHILAHLLPRHLDGSISTVPVSYKPWFILEEDKTQALEQTALRLARLTEELAGVHRETGREIHIDLEPEPDGLIETTEELVDFFLEYLEPIAARHIGRRLGLAYSRSRALLRRHIGICYDACHLAVGYESSAASISRLQEAGIRIGKVQLSNALKVNPQEADSTMLFDRLAPFAESTYLHQVVARRGDGSLEHFRDLSHALCRLGNDIAEEWRIHFHVPVFSQGVNGLGTTQQELSELVDMIGREKLCTNLEIETYTWGLLPPPPENLVDGIEKEYRWVMERI